MHVKDGIKIELLVLCSNVKVLIECVKGNGQLENIHLKFIIDNYYCGGFLKEGMSFNTVS